MAAEAESCSVNGIARPEAQKISFPVALLLLSKPGIVLAEVMAALAGMLLATGRTSAATGSWLILPAIALAAGGAAMLNGLLDAAPDRRMPRVATRCRALETAGSGPILAISITLMAAGMALAAVTTTLPAVLLLAGGCLAYIWLYTAWLKRRSPWAVLAGGIPGALPPIIGTAAVSGTISAAPLLLAAVIFIWQLPHFWLLALDCRDQYERAGIPVLPVTHGEPLTKTLTLATTLLLLPTTIALGRCAALSSAWFAAAGAAGVIFAFICARSLYLTKNYRQGFIGSLVYLLTIISAVCADFIFI
jgi:protoheme IX farnesyltransferase